MILFFDGDDSPEIHCCFVDLSSRRMVGKELPLLIGTGTVRKGGCSFPICFLYSGLYFRDRICFLLFHDILAIPLLFLVQYLYILIYSQFSSLRALAPLLHAAAMLTKFTPFMKH